jgi:hypothetical protein
MNTKFFKSDSWEGLRNAFPTSILGALTFMFFLFSLYLIGRVNFLLFHTLAELFSIIIAFGIFMIAWNAKRFFENHYLLFISIGYFFVTLLDITHTLAYKGMGIFDFFDPTANLATQLWIAARYLQAFSLLIAPMFLAKKLKLKTVLGGYTLVTSLILLSIFYFQIFPVAFIEGEGLTAFKKISEYLISVILAISAVLLIRKKELLDKRIHYPILLSIFFTIMSELTFTTYFSVSDFSNIMGHYFKIIAFYFLYKAIIEVSLKNPFA